MYRYLHLNNLPASSFVKDSVAVKSITPQSMIEQFELTKWQGAKAPNHDLKQQPIPNSFYVYRKNMDGTPEHDNKILHTNVTSRWPLIQFDEGAKWFNRFTSTGQLTVSSALVVNDNHFGVTCDLGLQAEIGPDDTIDRFFMLSLSHSPGMPRILGFTDIRAICSNTLQAAATSSMKKADSFFNLDADVDKALLQAANMLNLVERRFNAIDVPAYQHMRQIKVTETERDLLYRQLVGMPLEGRDVAPALLEGYDMLHEVYLNSPGMELFGKGEHTGWRTLQAVTFAAGNMKGSGLDQYLIQFKGTPWTKKTHQWLALRFDSKVAPLGSKMAVGA